MERIGLVGLGLVGTALFEILLEEQYELVGFDIDAARGAALEKVGGKVLSSPAQVAENVDTVILSLPDTNVVREVVEGPGGILEAGSLPTYIIDTTTGDPDETSALAERVRGRGIHFLDATISGSSRQIRCKQAVYMVGGDKEAFEACRGIFQVLTQKIFYLGPSGSGSRAKLASNLILGLNRAALAEGLVFADKLGLDLEIFLDMLKTTPAYSAVMDSKGKKMLHDDFIPESRIRQHYKDVDLILQYGGKLGQALPLSQVHAELLESALSVGEGDLDNAAIICEVRRRRRPEKNNSND